jgi:hypothetical protein
MMLTTEHITWQLASFLHHFGSDVTGSLLINIVYILVSLLQRSIQLDRLGTK